MDMEKVYYDLSGDPKNIRQMIKHEPEWAASMIQYYEKRVEELERKIKKFIYDESHGEDI